MSTTTHPKYPTAVYAVAGAGDLAYRELLNALPMVAGLPARVEQLRTEVPAAVNTFVAEAVQVYSDLVVRGTKIVDGPGTPAAPNATPANKAPAKKATKATRATAATVTKSAPKARAKEARAKEARAKKTAR